MSEQEAGERSHFLFCHSGNPAVVASSREQIPGTRGGSRRRTLFKIKLFRKEPPIFTSHNVKSFHGGRLGFRELIWEKSLQFGH